MRHGQWVSGMRGIWKWQQMEVELRREKNRTCGEIYISRPLPSSHFHKAKFCFVYQTYLKEWIYSYLWIEMWMIVFILCTEDSCSLYTENKCWIPEPLLLINEKWCYSTVYLKTSGHISKDYILLPLKFS